VTVPKIGTRNNHLCRAIALAQPLSLAPPSNGSLFKDEQMPELSTFYVYGFTTAHGPRLARNRSDVQP
jgi:hypothetical protein